MGTLIVFHPDGTQTKVEKPRLDFKDLYQFLDCQTVQPVRCRYEGKVYDMWVDEDGPMRRKPMNPQIKSMVEDYYKFPCQEFVGAGAIFVPTPKVKKP